ncbi:hypothetical protein SDJN03_10113, partial [Cucurbita argyrosperma subsp. sororia]
MEAPPPSFVSKPRTAFHSAAPKTDPLFFLFKSNSPGSPKTIPPPHFPQSTPDKESHSAKVLEVATGENKTGKINSKS